MEQVEPHPLRDEHVRLDPLWEVNVLYSPVYDRYLVIQVVVADDSSAGVADGTALYCINLKQTIVIRMGEKSTVNKPLYHEIIIISFLLKK